MTDHFGKLAISSLFVLLILAAIAWGTDSTYTGGAGTAYDYWDDIGNWDNGVPSATINAYIITNATGLAFLSTATSATASNLIFNGTGPSVTMGAAIQNWTSVGIQIGANSTQTNYLSFQGVYYVTNQESITVTGAAGSGFDINTITDFQSKILSLGNTANGSGTFTFQGSSVGTVLTNIVGGASGSTGLMHMVDGVYSNTFMAVGNVNTAYGVLSNMACTIIGDVYLGSVAGGIGRADILGGTIEPGTSFRVGQLGPATCYQSGGLIKGGQIIIGAASVGAMYQSGGYASGSLTLGNTTGGKGTLISSNGTNSFSTINVSNNTGSVGTNIIAGENCVWTNTGTLKIGAVGPGVMIISNGTLIATATAAWQQGLSGAATSQYDQYGGVVDYSAASLTLAVNSSGNAKFNMYGGWFTNKSITGGNSASQSFCNFIQTGGVFVTTNTITLAQNNNRALWSIQGGTNETKSSFMGALVDGISSFIVDIGARGYMYVTNGAGTNRFVVGRTGSGYLTNGGTLVANDFFCTNTAYGVTMLAGSRSTFDNATMRGGGNSQGAVYIKTSCIINP